MWKPNEIELQLPHHEMVWVEGGVFLMGNEDEEAYSDEKPVHKVHIKTFLIAKYLVTQSLWKTVMETDMSPAHFQGNKRPIEQVSWYDVQEFLQKLNKYCGRAYRLPSEAEWEFAARGGVKSRGHKYAGSDKLDEVGWFDGNNHEETKPIGLKMPNELGLFDVSGNVGEWVQDYWSDTYQELPLAGSPLEDTEKDVSRVVRGGYEQSATPRLSRVSFRDPNSPNGRFSFVGFRLALSTDG